MTTPDGPDQPYPTQQPYPSQEPYSGQEPYPGQQPYPSQPAGVPQTAMPTTPAGLPAHRRPRIVAVVATAVVAAAVVVLTVFNHVHGDGPSSSATVTRTSGPRPSGPTSVRQITVPAVTPGWQGVLSYRDGVAYDVPPGWKVETPGTLVGFEDADGKPLAIMHGVSTYRDDACAGAAGSYRGRVGLVTVGNAEPATAARAGVKLFAAGIAYDDDGPAARVSATTSRNITVASGSITARYTRATVTPSRSDDCPAPSVAVIAVAFRVTSASSALFVAYVDQGVPDALPLATARQIAATLRPYRR